VPEVTGRAWQDDLAWIARGGRVGGAGDFPVDSDLPRAFRTADLWLIHAADCCSRYSSWTCCGVRYWSPECRRLELYQNSMYLATSRRPCSRVGYWVRLDTFVLKSGEERLRHSIVVTYPGAADGLPEVMYLQRPGELTGRVVLPRSEWKQHP